MKRSTILLILRILVIMGCVFVLFRFMFSHKPATESTCVVISLIAMVFFKATVID